MKNKTKKTLLISSIFGLFGITIEIIFTSFYPLFSKEIFSWSLQGSSYIWMFFIYALIKPMFDFGYPILAKYNVFFRIFIYSLMILIIEFIAGFLLEQLTGNCPWKYTAGFTLMGYVRMDYIIFWMIFGYIIEYIYLLLGNVITFDKNNSSNTDET